MQLEFKYKQLQLKNQYYLILQNPQFQRCHQFCNTYSGPIYDDYLSYKNIVKIEYLGSTCKCPLGLFFKAVTNSCFLCYSSCQNFFQVTVDSFVSCETSLNRILKGLQCVCAVSYYEYKQYVYKYLNYYSFTEDILLSTCYKLCTNNEQLWHNSYSKLDDLKSILFLNGVNCVLNTIHNQFYICILNGFQLLNVQNVKNLTHLISRNYCVLQNHNLHVHKLLVYLVTIMIQYQFLNKYKILQVYLSFESKTSIIDPILFTIGCNGLNHSCYSCINCQVNSKISIEILTISLQQEIQRKKLEK
ncbi:unnamed protein product [Paramecium primaurelia]|uniref:Uncharacterized protein n=1 Tax=Paramecium primaurelia TaxID=5886 RepID=A0A8S1MKL9_PARPR|nr:unnamed protein product [Paramecium primaurelia]